MDVFNIIIFIFSCPLPWQSILKKRHLTRDFYEVFFENITCYHKVSNSLFHIIAFQRRSSIISSGELLDGGAVLISIDGGSSRGTMESLQVSIRDTFFSLL